MYLGIDPGTSAFKAILVDDAQRVVADLDAVLSQWWFVRCNIRPKSDWPDVAMAT